MKKIIILFFVAFLPIFVFGQYKNYELGVEIQAASISSHGGTFGGALKFSVVEDNTWAFGPSLRYQYIWSDNSMYFGTVGKSFTLGGGGFLHYRFFDWFFLGTEIELLRNPYNYINPDKKWALTAFLGGGISKEFSFVRINLGLLYDLVDGFQSPFGNNPSPLSSSYFVRISDANNPNMGKYIPLIYRLAFFFPLTKN